MFAYENKLAERERGRVEIDEELDFSYIRPFNALTIE